MPATAKLYETDPYVQTFTATVLVCIPAGEQFAVQLDRTAFYPEGGGQPCDTGALGTALVRMCRSMAAQRCRLGRRWKAALIGRAAATIWSSTPVNTF